MKKRIITCICAAILLMLSQTSVMAEETHQQITLQGYDENSGFEYIELGVYPYYSNGAFAPVIWRVLSVNGDMIVLRSEYSIFPMDGNRYTNVYDMIAKDKLFQKYVLSDKAIIAAASISINDLTNTSYGYTSNAQADTLYVKPSPYTASKGLKTNNGYVSYWTYNGKTPYCFTDNGEISEVTNAATHGVVPIITVSANALHLNRGSGTLDYPYYNSSNVLNLFLEQKMAINASDAATARNITIAPGLTLYKDTKAYYALATLSNPDHRDIKVFTGPGSEYYWHGVICMDKVALKLLGVFGNWAWIEYKADLYYSGYDDVYNTGYIRTIYIDKYTAAWNKCFSFPAYSLPARMKIDASLYDDRFMIDAPLDIVQAGVNVTFLGFLDQGCFRLAYIETTLFNKLTRGFVPFSAIEIDDAGVLFFMSEMND